MDVSILANKWALAIDEVELNGLAYTDFDTNIALLVSSYEYIGVPNDLLKDINNLFKEEGFICPSSSTTCAIPDSCDAVAGGLPVMNFTFTNTSNTFTVMITPEVYLFQEENQCSTLISENTETTASFALGDPFFRNSTVALDFSTKTI